MPPPSASEGLNPDVATVARFAGELGALIDCDRDTVLVAVSGGPDSVALLLLAQAVLGARCRAATVNHGLRAAAAAEADWVARLCRTRGIDHAILRDDLPGRAGGTANLPARARALRYRLLARHAAGLGDAWLATAHHADDQLETVMMRLNRGAGVAGLAGIRHRTDRLIRPLLGWRRAELAAVVQGCGIAAVADPSNVDDRYDRARLRKLLAGADWLDAAGVGRSATALAAANEALDWSARALWRERCVHDGDALTLAVAALPDEYLRRLVTMCVEHFAAGRPLPGPALTQFIAILTSGRPSALADVLAVPVGDGRWQFRRAPPRRAT